MVENYESDISGNSSEDESKEEEVVYPEQNIFSQVQIKLTTPTKTEYDILMPSATSRSAPTSPTLVRRLIPIEMTPNSSEESGVESATFNMMRQRSQSVEILPNVGIENGKQSNPAQSTKSRAFSRFTTGIANRFKTKNKFFGDPMTPSVSDESDPSVKPSAISAIKKTVTSLKEKTQRKTKTKTNMISI